MPQDGSLSIGNAGLGDGTVGDRQKCFRDADCSQDPANQKAKGTLGIQFKSICKVDDKSEGADGNKAGTCQVAGSVGGPPPKGTG